MRWFNDAIVQLVGMITQVWARNNHNCMSRLRLDPDVECIWVQPTHSRSNMGHEPREVAKRASQERALHTHGPHRDACSRLSRDTTTGWLDAWTNSSTWAGWLDTEHKRRRIGISSSPRRHVAPPAGTLWGKIWIKTCGSNRSSFKWMRNGPETFEKHRLRFKFWL